MKSKSYNFGSYATVESDNGKFYVFNNCTGLQEGIYDKWEVAKEHAMMIKARYEIIAAGKQP